MATVVEVQLFLRQNGCDSLDLLLSHPRVRNFNVFFFMAGRIRSKCFAITLNHVEWDKTCFIDFLMSDDLIEAGACGQEPHHPPLDPHTGEPVLEDPKFHQHIFIRFFNRYFLTEIRTMIEEFLCGVTYSFDVQTCRSPKAWLKYLSKQDFHPYVYNIRVDDLSFFARCWYHAKTYYKTVRPLDRADFFITSCGQNARFAISIIEQHLYNLRCQQEASRVVLPPNRTCSLSNRIEGLINGVNHIYMEGVPGLGKTELIDFCLKGRRVWKAGEPSPFLFGTLSETIEFIWFEDFDLRKYSAGYLSTLLSLMDHKPVTISRKGCDDRTITVKAKFVFTSNYPLPSEYTMFKRRVTYVHVPHKLYCCTGCIIGDFDIDGEDIFDDLDVINGDLTRDLTLLPGVPRFSQVVSTPAPSDDHSYATTDDLDLEEFFNSM